MTPRIGSLFSGYGGLDMAVLAFYGGSLAWYAEVEPAACKVLAAHHPEVPNLGDVTRIDWTQVEPVDAITAGYPCQPFSHAGKRKGKNDERHLWPYVRDAIGALGPRLVVLENVAGHLSMGLADVVGDLAGLGYDARWGLVRASDAGAPHRRARVFIVAFDADSGRRQQCKPEPLSQGDFGLAGLSADADGHGHGGELHARGMGSVEGQAAGGAPERKWARGVADAGGDLAAADAASDERRVGNRDSQPAADADSAGSEAWVDSRRHGGWLRVECVGLTAPAADADGGRGSEVQKVDGRGRAVGGTWSRAGGGDRAGDSAEGVQGLVGGAGTQWGKYAPAIRRWERVLGRPAPSPTVPGANGRPRLSPLFVEWMMGLPEGHVTGHGLSTAACLKMLGNGVVPQQAALALTVLLSEQVAA